MRTHLFFILLATAILSACAISPIDESDEIAEMWAFARAHRTTDLPDSGRVVYVADPAALCNVRADLATPVGMARYRVSGCTVLGAVPYSILSMQPTAEEIAHEAAHRMYGDWHHGYIYIGSRELMLLSARVRP